MHPHPAADLRQGRLLKSDLMLHQRNHLPPLSASLQIFFPLPHNTESQTTASRYDCQYAEQSKHRTPPFVIPFIQIFPNLSSHACSVTHPLHVPSIFPAYSLYIPDIFRIYFLYTSIYIFYHTVPVFFPHHNKSPECPLSQKLFHKSLLL